MIKIKRIICLSAVVAALGCLTGCSFGVRTNYTYDNGDKYVAGDREISENIEILDIDYVSGEITLNESDTEKISIKETAKVTLDDKQKVHTWVNGSTLYVRYCASAKGLDLNDLDKKLTMDMPKGIELSKLKIQLSSGDLSGGCAAKNIKLNASSGNLTFEQKGSSEEISVEVSSGKIDLTAENADDVKLISSSGEIKADIEKVKNYKSESSSGDENISFTNVPEETSIVASSGDITLHLPKDASVSADISTSSGDVSSDIEHSKPNKDGNKYVFGGGKNKMSITTSSGDVEILGK